MFMRLYTPPAALDLAAMERRTLGSLRANKVRRPAARRAMGAYVPAPWVKPSVRYGLGACVYDPDTGEAVTCDDSDSTVYSDATIPPPQTIPGVSPLPMPKLPDSPPVIVTGPAGTRPTVLTSNPSTAQLITSIINAGASAVLAATRPRTAGSAAVLSAPQAQAILQAQAAQGGAIGQQAAAALAAGGAYAPAQANIFGGLGSWLSQPIVAGSSITNGVVAGGAAILVVIAALKSRRN